MAVVLENISTSTIVAKTTISAVYRTAQIIAAIPNLSYHNKALPEALFHQLLLAMAYQTMRSFLTLSVCYCEGTIYCTPFCKVLSLKKKGRKICPHLYIKKSIAILLHLLVTDGSFAA
ncbi:uncharacterized protein LOC131225625 isoform X2 [Magnolia sinica]|uniref:uncharacterized protein LOC131225625 isoform X2 n=1 Tax=Magnolia sinica TaxID=86752 RepID=UPI002658BE66|nr:uncharacterized protein LOC131225625 isoform X2 [Magnolia sinica]